MYIFLSTGLAPNPVVLYIFFFQQGSHPILLFYTYFSFNSVGLAVIMCCFFHVVHIWFLFTYFCCLIFSLKRLNMCCYLLIFSFGFHGFLNILLIIIIITYHF